MVLVVKRFLSVFVVGLLMLTGAFAVELRGTASVNVTSDTAANAKNMAFDEARRQIIGDVLRQYADVNMLNDAIKNASATDLTNLIAKSSIDGEQLSDTTYSANITMQLDEGAARDWMVGNNIQNWLPDSKTSDTFIVLVNMSNGLANWVELNRIARAEKIDLGTQNITADSATLSLPVGARGAFTIALREAGWRYTDQDGALRIWK